MTHDSSLLEVRGNGQVGGGGTRALHRRTRTTIATGDTLDARSFHVQERMSSLFEVRVVAVSDNPDIDFEGVIGNAMSFTLEADKSRTWSGICADIHQIGVEERHLSTYELTLVPSLWLAGERRNHRMFQLMSEIDIVLKVLGEWGISPALRLSSSYKKRKIRVQYGESDYAFISRMLEDAGVSFYFDGEGQVVLDDGPQHNAPRAPIAFRDHPTHADLEHVTAVRVGRRLKPGAFTVRDHDYRRPPAYKLMQSAAGGAGVEPRLERFHYAPGAFLYESDKGDSTPQADDKGKYRADEAEGAALARRRLDAERSGAHPVTFQTNTFDPAPGTVLSFLDHPKSELTAGKQLLVTESSFEGEIPGQWTHTCTAVSANAPYRPPHETPRPKVQGVESATVVGPPGEEIHVDEFGRVRVSFHWDRESKMDDHSSCWIHVSQPWGGASFGGINLPRVGQEVVVDFLGGDPDRPLIVGRVYTNLQKVPYKLPENKTQSAWKSNSTGGKGGYNEIMFEDRAGVELVRIQAEKDLAKLVKNDETVTIGEDKSTEIGRDESLSVGRDRKYSVGRDETSSIGRDRRLTVGHDHERATGHDESLSVGHDFAQTVGHDKDTTVGATYTVNVSDHQRETVGQNLSTSVGQNRTSEVAQVDATTVGEQFFVKVKPPPRPGSAAADGDPTSLTMEHRKIVLTTGGGATITMEGAEVTIQAQVIKLLADKNIEANARDEDISLHAGTDIRLASEKTLHASTADGVLSIAATGGDVEVRSNKNVSVTASADVALTARKGNASLVASKGNTSVAAAKGNVSVAGKKGAVLASGEGTTVTGKDVNVLGDKTAVLAKKGRILVQAVGGYVKVQGDPWVMINPHAQRVKGHIDASKSVDLNKLLASPGRGASPAKKPAVNKAAAEQNQAAAARMGAKFQLPPALVLALMIARSFAEEAAALAQALSTLRSLVEEVQGQHPTWTAAEHMAGAVASYCSGSGGAQAEPGDAASEMWAQAQWYSENLHW